MAIPFATAAYSPHCKPKAMTALNIPSSSPSYTKGQRINPLVAPTIFIIAISSRRSKVVSLMVLEIINTDTSSSMAISAMEITPATLRTVVKPFATASSARALAIPGMDSTAAFVSIMRSGSVTWITNRWRNTVGSRSPYTSSSSYFST